MNQLYVYSLVPVVSVGLLLFFSAALHGRNARGLAAYCFAVAFWSGTLLLAFFPYTAGIGQRLAASGGFVAAAYLHAAYDFTDQRRFPMVWLAYAVAFAIWAVQIFQPGLLYDPVHLTAGPVFWPVMALALVAATLPLWQLARAYQRAGPDRRPQLVGLFLAGALGYAGAWINTFLLTHGRVLPVGMFIELGSLFVLAHVVRRQQAPGVRRLLERSLLYSGIAAFLSAGFLFGVLHLMGGRPMVTEYRLSVFFLLVMAALAFEPLRQQIQEFVGKRLLKSAAHATDLAEALADRETRLRQAERLAELGAFASAVAHEVRNPLGVLGAHLRLAERVGTLTPETASSMREQITRAEHFVGALLRYGRPAPLELRTLDLRALAELAFSTARQGRQGLPEVALDTAGLPEELPLEADQAQLLQALVALFDNALLALEHAAPRRVRVTGGLEGGRVRLVVEDTGPGIPPELASRLFQPFVTGRKREGPRPGTGLGLAIVRGIVDRHQGTLLAGRSDDLGGARFELTLPRVQPVLAAAAEAS